MQAMCGGHHEVFAYEAMWRQDGFNLRAFMCQKGIAKVSLRVGDWRHLEKRKNSQSTETANINEPIEFQDI